MPGDGSSGAGRWHRVALDSPALPGVGRNRLCNIRGISSRIINFLIDIFVVLRLVDASLKQSLRELRQAEKNAVLWFADVLHRKLFRELGFSSIHQYAELELGFSLSKTSQFIRLSRSLKTLPALKRSVARGEISWTKAREVAKVATPKTEKSWVREARQSSSRALERKVAVARVRAKAAMGSGRSQETLPLGNGCGSTGSEGRRAPRVEVPVDVLLRFSPEQFARLEALVEKLRKLGEKGAREEVLLAGLGGLVEERLETDSPRGVSSPEGTEPAESMRDDEKPRHRRRQSKRRRFTRVNSAPTHQVVVQQCDTCERASVVTGRGPRPISPRELKAILCDARVSRKGERNRATIPPSMRRTVLERDRYRCRAAGCRSTRFLSVHHLVPREVGGSNDPENLITLCAGCHRLAHEHRGRSLPLARIA